MGKRDKAGIPHKLARTQREETAERARRLGEQLDRLWNLHRCEMAMAMLYKEEPTDRLGSEWFVDFLDMTHMRASKLHLPRLKTESTNSELKAA